MAEAGASPFVDRAGAPTAHVLLRKPDDEYIFKLGICEPLIISELGIKTSA